MTRVTAKCCGSLTLDAGVLVSGESGTVEAPSTVVLIEAEKTVLVDTSFGDPSRMTDRHPGFSCSRTENQQLRAVLEAEEYSPGDIDTVVFTHLDWDHCYNLDIFGDDTRFFVSDAELAYARDPYPLHATRYEASSPGYEPPWESVDFTPVSGETELCEGVVAFPTPGHTVGHQSIAVETDEGTTVVAGDAVPTFANVSADRDTPVRKGLAMDEISWWESAVEVLDRADTLLPGHEWEILAADPAGLA